MPRPKLTVIDRLNTWSIPEPNSGCVLWLGALSHDGYGWFKLDKKMMKAHRVAYTAFIGQIPDGLVIDHICRNRACINPVHLEPVTTRENILRGRGPAAINARKTTCPAGHQLDDHNTYWEVLPKHRQRRCRACGKAPKGVGSPSSRVACTRGHAYDEANTYVDPRGRRNCRVCNREAARRYKARLETP